VHGVDCNLKYHQMLVSPHIGGGAGILVADAYEGYARRIASLLDNPAQRNVILEAEYRHVRDHHDMKQYCERILGEYDDLLLA
jgi:glycosyltransferase involved in cell wall biosynthesis